MIFLKVKRFVGRILYKIREEKRARLLQSSGEKALEHTIHLLIDNRVKYWLDGGTLLGVVRDGSFIAGDTDIDIAVMIYDSDVLYNILKEDGYNINYFYADSENKKILIRAEIFNVGIDFEIFAEDENYYFYESPRPVSKEVLFPIKNQNSLIRFKFHKACIEELKEYSFSNIVARIPSDLDEYFSVYYYNWEIPQDKREYLDNYFSDDICEYEHHNDKALYLKNHFCYFSKVSETTNKLNYLDILKYFFKKVYTKE